MEWIPYAVVILGFVPMLVVWLRQSLRKRFIARAEETTGVVEAMEQRIGHKGNKYYVATINYTAGMDKIRRNHILPYSQRTALTPGQQVVVLYNPKKPIKFVLRDFPYNFKFLWIFTGIIAIAYFVLAYFLSKELKGAYYSPPKAAVSHYEPG
jgi:hypothetical protein